MVQIACDTIVTRRRSRVEHDACHAAAECMKRAQAALPRLPLPAGGGERAARRRLRRDFGEGFGDGGDGGDGADDGDDGGGGERGGDDVDGERRRLQVEAEEPVELCEERAARDGVCLVEWMCVCATAAMQTPSERARGWPRRGGLRVGWVSVAEAQAARLT